MKKRIKLKTKINCKNYNKLKFQKNYKICKFKIINNLIYKLEACLIKIQIINNNQIFIKKDLKYTGIYKL